MTTTVSILRQLWRFKLLVVVVGLLSVCVGFAVAYKLSWPLESRKYEVGVATVRILVDTPDSQVVEVAPEGSDTLGARATLLANLMVDGEIKDAIAKRAGLDPKKLIGLSQTAGVAQGATVKPGRDDFVLTTEVLPIPNGGWLPVIEVDTQAPEAEGAERLANAAVSGLTDFLESRAASDAVPNAERLRVGGLGTAQAQQVTRGPRLLYALAAMFFVFVAGCGAIVMGAALVRGLRDAEAAEAAETGAVPPSSAARPHPPADAAARPPAVSDGDPAFEPWPAASPSAHPEAYASGEVDAHATHDAVPTAERSVPARAWWGGGPA